jgi:hypothetical protein
MNDPVTEWIADIIRNFDDDKATIREILNSALSKDVEGN